MLVALFIGVAVGSIYGLTAMGLVLTYRTSGVFNLAHGALGMVGTFAFWELWQQHDWPMLPALVVAVGVVAPMLGVAAHLLIFRWVHARPVVVGLVGGIALLVTLQGVANVIWGPVSRSLPSLFPFHVYKVTGGFNTTSEQMGTVAVTLLVAGALLWYLHGTDLGLKMRAVVDNRELAELSRQRAEVVHLIAWMVASSMATLSGILISPFIQLDLTGLTLVVIQAMAAAVLGRLSSLPLVYLGGLGLGVIESIFGWYLPDSLQGLRTSAAFLVLYGATLAGATRFRFFPAVTTALPASLLGRPADPARRFPLVVIGAALALAVPFLSPFLLILVTGGLIVSIAFQGFVLVTGLGGEVVLAQAAFMGIGALVYSRATVDFGLPVLLAVALAVLVAGAFGLLIALPATRLHGLPLVLLTLAFGLFADNYLFTLQAFAGGYGGFLLDRPVAFGLDLDDNAVFAYVVLGCALGAALLVGNLAAGRSGRMLVAARNAPVAVESLGSSVRDAKLVVFLLGSAFAGLAGVLVALQLEAVAALQFNIALSILYLAVAVLGGVSNPQGALVGGLLLYGGPDLLGRIGGEQWQQAFFGVGAALILMAGRGGLADMVSRPLLRIQDAFRLPPQLVRGRVFAMTSPPEWEGTATGNAEETADGGDGAGRDRVVVRGGRVPGLGKGVV